MMVVRRDGSNRGKLGKKIVRTLAAGMVVVPGLLGGQLAMAEESENTNEIFLESIPEAPITLRYGQIVHLGGIMEQNELYGFRISSSHIDEGDLEGNFFKPEQPGTYTVYLYDTHSNYYNLEAYSTFDVVVPYPDANNDGIIDISDIVKYMTAHEYDIEIGEEILSWVDSSRKAANVAPTINGEYIFEPQINMTCTNMYSLNSLFNDENTDSLKYSIVGNIPESMGAVISGGYKFDSSTCMSVWQDVINYVFREDGTSTITVRATDGYGKFADRNLTFEGYETLHYYGGEYDIGWVFNIGESDEIVSISASVVDNDPKDIGRFDDPVVSHGEMYYDYYRSLNLSSDNIEYVDGIAKALIKVDVITKIGDEPEHTHTRYFKIIAYDYID